MAKMKSRLESTPPPDDLPRRPLKQEVLTLRIDESTMEWLKEVADKKGLGASTLVRMWMLERLAEEGAPSTGEWVRIKAE